jgi:hypothetical protein
MDIHCLHWKSLGGQGLLHQLRSLPGKTPRALPAKPTVSIIMHNWRRACVRDKAVSGNQSIDTCSEPDHVLPVRTSSRRTPPLRDGRRPHPVSTRSISSMVPLARLSGGKRFLSNPSARSRMTLVVSGRALSYLQPDRLDYQSMKV